MDCGKRSDPFIKMTINDTGLVYEYGTIMYRNYYYEVAQIYSNNSIAINNNHTYFNTMKDKQTLIILSHENNDSKAFPF